MIWAREGMYAEECSEANSNPQYVRYRVRLQILSVYRTGGREYIFQGDTQSSKKKNMLTWKVSGKDGKVIF